MKYWSNMILAAVLMLSACGGASKSLVVDSTQPVSDGNRVIYQMNVGAFTAEGTFQAATKQLARLDSLGVDIIWLMPIYPRGATMNSPYAAMDYKAVNPRYGTIDDVKAFVAHAHQLGIKVWLDWVPNHVAQENPWVQTHPDYFTRNDKGNMIHPHGWGDVLELNYQNPELVKEVNSALKFWIETCDIDGYRCDYVSSPTIPVAYWQDIIAQLKTLVPGKKIEMMSETDITDRHNQRIDSCGFDYDYAWSFQGSMARLCRRGFNADTLKSICQRFLDKSAKVKNRRMVYLTNHDQNYNDGGNTLRKFYGENRYGLTVLEFTFYGMPLIYNGQEIGDPDTLNYFTDAKVKWQRVDHKMLNTVRTLIALHHQQPALAESAPVKFLNTSCSDVLAWQRDNVVVVVSFADYDTEVTIDGIEAGNYQQWLNSQTIYNGPSLTKNSLPASPTLSLEAKGYAVYVKQ
ncbi:alpha-amylase family glycosyl hydrolase [Xylanibacter ruminicola]|nr:alpha-amylase family glycosyl hydrolase [Xylanibacter ruminicola]